MELHAEKDMEELQWNQSTVEPVKSGHLKMTPVQSEYLAKVSLIIVDTLIIRTLVGPEESLIHRFH